LQWKLERILLEVRSLVVVLIGLCRGVLHGGDSDSTGAIGAAFFGALYGFDSVPKINYENLEYRERMEKLGAELFALRSTAFQS
jgi:hypothetical protein